MEELSQEFIIGHVQALAIHIEKYNLAATRQQ
jgi:hypothetical protein